MKHRLFTVVIVLLMLIFSVNAYADESVEIFQYPVTPEMEEWSEFQSLDEMIEACQIPDNILSKMSTDELVEVVANYPLAINVCAYDTPQKGIEHIKEYFNGLQELSKRSAAIESVDAYLDKYERAKSTDFVKETFTKAVYQMLVSEKEENELSYLSREAHSNYTPNGSRIYLLYNLDWSYHNTAPEDVDSLEDGYKVVFPKAIPIRGKNPAYNCHSYAWYSTSPGNLYWLQQVYAEYYMSDGSYTRTYSPVSGDKVWYGSADHSAIYNSNSQVTSKWGYLGLYSHDVGYCPYSSKDVSYWKK